MLPSHTTDALSSPTRDLAFISYSQRDKHWLDRILVVLKPYLKQGHLHVWADSYIKIGDDWRREIDRAIGRAKLGVLLISTDFAATDFITEVEVPALLRAADRHELRLFCIPVRSVDINLLGAISRYQWARRPEAPLDLLSQPELEAELVRIVKALVLLFNATPDGPPGAEAAHDTTHANRPSRRAAQIGATTNARQKLATKALREKSDVLGELHNPPELPPHFVYPRDALQRLKTALASGETPVLGISAPKKAGLHGQGGIGKTVLATALVHDEEVRRVFADGILWLTLGQHPNVVALQQHLSLMLTGEQHSWDLASIGTAILRKQLAQKRCLIVIDDVWRLEHLTAFAVADGPARLLITTRDREILDAVGATVQNLDVLEPDAALELLANWCGSNVSALPAEARHVLDECGRLPLALSLAGAQVRSGASFTEVLHALRLGNLRFLDHPHGSVFNSLSISVAALPVEAARRYLEFAIFAEDRPIPESVVVRLWRSSGLNEEDAKKLLRTFAGRALLTLTGEVPDRAVLLHDLQLDYLRLALHDPAQTHARLLDSIYRTLAGGDIGPGRWALLPTNQEYVWRHLVYHVLESGRYQLLEDLVSNADWLRRKMAANGLPALLADLELVVARAPSERSCRIEKALRTESGSLYNYPHSLDGSLYNRLLCGGMEAHAIEKLILNLRTQVRLVVPIDLGGGELRHFQGHTDRINGCAYSPDGCRIVTASADGSVREWDRAAGNQISYYPHASAVTACAYSPDATRIISACGNTLREWDCATKKEIRTFVGHAKEIERCVYSADGARILSVSGDGTAREWNCASGAELHRFQGFHLCAYSPDGQQIVTGYGLVLLEWDRRSGSESKRFDTHVDPYGRQHRVVDCMFLDGGQRLVSASTDNGVREWDRETTVEARKLVIDHPGSTSAGALSPDGSSVVYSFFGRDALEWDRTSGAIVRRFNDHSDAVTAFAYSSEGTRLLSGCRDGTLREWDLLADAHLAPPSGNSFTAVNVCAHSPDGLRLLSGSRDGILLEWDRGGRKLAAWEGHKEVTACGYSPDGGSILTASFDYKVREWDSGTGDERRQFACKTDVRCCAYSPDGSSVLAAAGQDLVEWDRSSGQHRRSLRAHREPVTCFTFSPDGACVLSASWDCEVLEWDWRSGEAHVRFTGHSSWVTSCAYAPHGRTVFSSSRDGTVREWDRRNARELRQLVGHTRAVTKCALSPAGSHVVTASEDCTLRVWDYDTGDCVQVIFGPAPLNCLSVSHRSIIAGDTFGNFWILDCDWF